MNDRHSFSHRFRTLILQVVAGIGSLWLAKELVTGVSLKGDIKILLVIGAMLGLINFFIKPILNLITLPLRVLTFGLFTLVINMGIVWIVEIMFIELDITGLLPLLWTGIIVWATSLIASKI